MSNGTFKGIQAAIAVTPTDDPVKVADVAIRLVNLKDFDLKVVGCAIPSFFSLPPSSPMIGVPIPSFVMEQYNRSGRTEIQEVCNEIIGILDKRLAKDVKPEIDYIDGPLNQIVPTLVSTFDILIIPHPLKILTKFRILRPALDSLLIKYKKIPILFCVDTSICRRIVIAQINNCTNFQDEQILSRLADSVDVPEYRWFPGKSIRTMLPSEAGQQELQKIHDISELDDDSVLADQLGTWLVLSNAVTLSFFKYRKIRSMLSDWRGNLILLP